MIGGTILKWWNNPNNLRYLEDRNVQKDEYERVKNRVALEYSYSPKKSAMMILKGIFFAIALTGFEYAMKFPEVGVLLQAVFKVGFFISLVGILYVPYGLYNLIKSFMRK